jgi:hypothetical protein
MGPRAASRAESLDVRRPPVRSPGGCARRRPGHHEREGARVTQSAELGAPNGGDTNRAHPARRRFIAVQDGFPAMQRRIIAVQRVDRRVDDQNPVPRDPAADQHRHRPVRSDRIQHVGQPVAATPPHPPPVSHPAITRMQGERARHPHGCGAQRAGPCPIHQRVHPHLLRRKPCPAGVGARQGRSVSRVQ